ncbi:MAG: hypothetical protein AB7P14_08905 [Blastocatellales bacterium]
MNRIKRWWNSVSGKLTTDGNQTEDVTARELCRMLQRCPVCGGGFEEHLYAHFAVTVFAEERGGRVKEFLRACEEHQWETVQQFQEFDARRDAVVAYALRCSTGRLVALLERSPFESYEADRLIACDVLDDASGEQLRVIVPPGDWRKLVQG